MLICPNPKCGYKWQPRVPRPKVCPRCHRFLKEEDYDSNEPSMGQTEASR